MLDYIVNKTKSIVPAMAFLGALYGQSSCGEEPLLAYATDCPADVNESTCTENVYLDVGRERSLTQNDHNYVLKALVVDGENAKFTVESNGRTQVVSAKPGQCVYLYGSGDQDAVLLTPNVHEDSIEFRVCPQNQ